MARTWDRWVGVAAAAALLAVAGAAAEGGDRLKAKPGGRPTVTSDDADGDGIVAVVDNCTERANTQQQDGVPPANDLCPDGRPGQPPIGHGCPLFEVAARSRSVFAPLKARTERLSAELGKAVRLRGYEVEEPLAEAVRTLDSALESAGATQLCAVQRVGALADAHFQAAAEGVESAR